MTSMRMRLVSSVSFVALLLKRCRLPCEALVAASCCFTFETSTMQKPRVFGAFQTKLRNEPPKPSKIQDEKTWYLRQIRKKCNQKTRPKYYGTEIRNIVLLTKTTQTQVRVFKLVTKKPPKNKRHTPRGGRTHVLPCQLFHRGCYTPCTFNPALHRKLESYHRLWEQERVIWGP